MRGEWNQDHSHPLHQQFTYYGQRPVPDQQKLGDAVHMKDLGAAQSYLGI